MKLEYIKNNVNFVAFERAKKKKEKKKERKIFNIAMSLHIGETNWNTLHFLILNCLSTVESISFHAVSMETVLLKAIVKNLVIEQNSVMIILHRYTHK